MKVSAVIVTKGNTDLSPVLKTLPFDDVVVWDNSKQFDWMVYGRYVAMDLAKNDVIYTQDDDAVTDPDQVVAQYVPGVVTCNMPPERRPFYHDGIALMGWGSVFDRTLRDAFCGYFSHYPADEIFLRECDRVFTALNKTKLIDVPFEHLPHATDSTRMGQERRHLEDLSRIRARLGKIR